MSDLATVDDLEARVKFGTLTADDLTIAVALLADASAKVRAEAGGQQFTATTWTDVWCKVRRGMIRLPQRPVTAVTTVKDENNNPLTFQWLGDDRVRLSASSLNAWEIEPYRNPLGEVKVTYTAGGTVPDVVVAVTCNVVLRALGRDPRDGGLTQESVEGYAYQTGSIGAAGPVGLLPEEKLTLARYRRPHGGSYQGV